MSTANLPVSVRNMLAAQSVRLHHRLWHAVRNQSFWDNGLSNAQRQQLIAAGWQTPRFEREPEAGLDFLYMHRRMIDMVNQALATANDPNYLNVEGWDPIPWSTSDPDWPVPSWNAQPSDFPRSFDPQGLADSVNETKSPSSVPQMQNFANNLFKNRNWLATRTLDQVGEAIEWSIHGWMHLRWSTPPPPDRNSVDASNDWLFDPWSSHVNKVFWKLHGWIDDRIGDWEQATNQQADFSNAWDGAPGVMPSATPEMSFHHSADLKLLEVFEGVMPLIPMRMDQAVIEELLKEDSRTLRR